MAQRVERWTCDQQVVGSNPTRGKSYVTTLGKLFKPMCICHQAVYIHLYSAIYIVAEIRKTATTTTERKKGRKKNLITRYRSRGGDAVRLGR